ncbi:MAG: hypothetical protein ACR2ML_12790 [Solirubrobacteraceae bacterium]
MSRPPETFAEWLRDHPPPDEAFIQTLAATARRALSGEPFQATVRELLDEFALLPRDELRARAIAERPPDTGDPRHDAYLGALAEHLAVTNGLERPEWTLEPSRFLDRFWFVSETPGLRALALVHSPAASGVAASFSVPGRWTGPERSNGPRPDPRSAHRSGSAP